ncbi:MAG: hypothetical protein ACPGQL_09160 [Thermoplasmatota archaeon]
MTLALAGLLVAAMALPGAATAADPAESLEVANRDALVAYVNDNLDGKATYEDIKHELTGNGVTLEVDVNNMAALAASHLINLAPMLEVQTAAGMGSFPLVGVGLWLNVGGGGGFLPTTCANAIIENSELDGELPLLQHNGAVSSNSASFGGISGFAAATDTTGTTDDSVSHSSTVFGVGNYDGACIDIQISICFFGICIHFWVYLELYAVVGAITDDLGTGTSADLRAVQREARALGI